MVQRQTFPIDPQRIRNREAELLLQSPINWGTILAAIALPLLLGLGGWGVLVAETNETQKKLLTQIVEAFGAVNETCRNLDLMLEPVDNGYSLEQAIEHLSSENDIL